MSFFGQKLVENWFFCQKNLNPDFAATTVTKIQANQTMHCLFLKKNWIDDMSSISITTKK